MFLFSCCQLVRDQKDRQLLEARSLPVPRGEG
jgi:hypothetical protein